MKEIPTLDPRHRSWLTSFLDENHLNFATSPDMVASPAQIRFMVCLDPGEYFYPCTQQVFEEIMARVNSPLLGEMYTEAWAMISNLIKEKIEDPERQAFLLDLLNIKYQHETASCNIIPSRLSKRLFKLFVVTTQIEDPMREEKLARNKRVAALLENEAFIKAVNQPAGQYVPAPRFKEDNLEAHRRHLDATKLRRLFQASNQSRLWVQDQAAPGVPEWNEIFERPITGDGWGKLEDFLLAPREELTGHWVPRQILYLTDTAGEVVFDLAVINFLTRMGHKVFLAVKSAAFYELVHLGDILTDPTLTALTTGAEIISAPNLNKKQLATHLMIDRPLQIIPDGTMEDLNLLLASVTFARVFKEVDGIISRGAAQRRLFFEAPFEFIQDIYSISAGPDHTLSIRFKPRCPIAVSFSNEQLEAMALKITTEMRRAKENGMTVMFYSGIVGSVPGETNVAIEIMTTFIEDLQKKQSSTFVINPSSYFEPGMDADDLMYMWEIVQRSGLIDIWRFQTYQDIETSFALLGRKVPPQWVGKDATFSTGCTKEMGIALEVQREYPELQIIGPDPEKFSRRGEYGIGLFHDKRLTEIYEH
ncbi:MAG: ARMT1-like domain-containing protein [Pseudomonadota bacterium]